MNEYLSHEEIQAAKEEKDTQANDLDPTSDNKKDNIASSQIQPTIQAPSDRALGKGEGLLCLSQETRIF